MRRIVGSQPVAVCHRLSVGDVDHGVPPMVRRIGVTRLESRILLIGDRCVADIGVLVGTTPQQHPFIVGVVVRTVVNETEKLLLQPLLTVLNHLIHNGLHLVNQVLVVRFPFQLAQFGFLTGHHFVVADAHLLQ